METIIISGASSGLGSNLAKALVKKGFSVVLLARNLEKLKQLDDQLQLLVSNKQQIISHFAVDLTDATEVNAVFQEFSVIHKKCRGLINCAATWMGRHKAQELSTAVVQESLNLNLFTTLNPINALLTVLNEVRSEQVTIVNIGGTASLRGAAKLGAFAIAKSAVRTLSQSLAKELAADGIHVAHLVIDGLIANERTFALNPNTPKDCFMNMDSISEAIGFLLNQEPSCWTFELDLRPATEKW